MSKNPKNWQKKLKLKNEIFISSEQINKFQLFFQKKYNL